MKYILVVMTMADAVLLTMPEITEVLFKVVGLSKNAHLSIEEVKELCTSVVGQKKRVLVWDSLQNDLEMKEKIALLNDLLPYFEAIRFADVGVGLILQEQNITLEQQITLTQNSPSPLAVLSWIKQMPILPQVVEVSNQIPLDEIAVLSDLLQQNQIDCEIELLGAGKLEVFYSARKLINPLLLDSKKQEVASEDRPLQKNTLQQTQIGTVLFYDKDLFILDLADEIETYNVKRLSVACSSEQEREIFKKQYLQKDWQIALKEAWQTPTFRGFLRANRTDKPLERLKNQILNQYREKVIAVILEANKPDYCVIEVKQTVELPLLGCMITPEGKKMQVHLKTLQDLKGAFFDKVIHAGVYRISWIKYSFPTSIICLDSSLK